MCSSARLDRCALDATQQRLHTRNEHARTVGLGYEVVRAHGHAHDLVDLGHARREHDDGDVRLLAQLAADKLPVRARQREVEQHKVGAGGQDILDHVIEGKAVRSLVALTLEHFDDLVANGGVILDHEYARHATTSLPPPRARGRVRRARAAD